LADCDSIHTFQVLISACSVDSSITYAFDPCRQSRLKMVTSIKKLFQLFAVALALLSSGSLSVSAQDPFNFPAEDPIAGKAEEPSNAPQDAVTPAAQNPNQVDEKNPLSRLDQDPLQDPAAGEQDPMKQDPLLDEDDEPVLRPEQPQQDPGFQFPSDTEEKPGQTVVLNSKFAGWEQAGPSAGGRRLSKELRANWIMVNANGRFTGQVTPAKDADLDGMIVYLTSMGRIVRESKIDRNGIFEFSNIAAGPYSLVGWAENGFFAFGLNILEFNEANITKVRNNVRVIAIQNKTTLNTDWIQHYTPNINFRILGRYREAEGLDDPPSLYGISGLTANLPEAEPATSINSRPVTRTSSGGMLGRIHQMNSENGRPIDVRGTRVLLLQGDDVVAATDADNYGVFYFPQVDVGQYGLLAAGVDGIGLIGIDVVDGEADSIIMNEAGEVVDEKGQQPTEPYPFDFCMVSAETAGWMNHYASELAYRRNLLAPRKPSLDEQNRVCAGCEGAGCQHCQGTGLCTSRCQSFEDWAQNCCNQHQQTKLGSGYILSEASKDMRRIINRSNSYFEKAFYGSSGSGVLGGEGGSGYGYQNGYGADPYYGNGGNFEYQVAPDMAPNSGLYPN
jgi:hypothetical protein